MENTNPTIKTNLKLCGICGDKHSYDCCKYLNISKHIPDKLVESKARLSSPDILEIVKLADQSSTIVAKTNIPIGVQFGPFIAKLTDTLNPFVLFPLKVFIEEDNEITTYYLDTTDENECCWMMFVLPATKLSEQNLICYQDNNNIYFATMRPISKGDVLRVWYSPYYATKMQKNLLVNTKEVVRDVSNKMTDLNAIVKDQQKIIPREVWNCKFCYKLEKNVTDFAQHLYNHYSLQSRKICSFCKQSFLHIKDYKNHLRLFHESSITEAGKPNNQTQIISKNLETVNPKKGVADLKDNCVGGPLLVHNLLNDGFDNSNLLVQQQEISSMDIGVHDLLDADNLNLGVDGILNHTFDYLNSESSKKEDEKEEFLCDICLKTFNSSKSITLHLKLHMGKYFCTSCKKVFGRLENLKQHKCNQVLSLKCPKCDKLFYQRKYLVRHIAVVHEKRFHCKACRKSFYSSHDLTTHVCLSVPEERRTKFKCDQCSKVFFKESYLKKHLRVHTKTTKDRRTTNSDSYICSECSKTFSTKRVYNRHFATVHEGLREHECRICDKTFSRRDILKNHMLNIHMIGIKEMFSCTECGKEFKSKKNLQSHKSTHGQVGFKCHCGALFKHKYNLHRHCKQFHRPNANNPVDEMLIHECPICHNKVKLKRSLQRHIRRKHAEEYKNICLELSARKVKFDKKRKSNKFADDDFDYIDTDQKCMDLQKTIENMDFNIDTCNDNLYSGTETIDKFLKESSEQIDSLFTDNPKVIDIPNDASGAVSVNKVRNREVCLSMPDLCEMDQEIKLGKNAYILENGNIVEPQGNSSNVVVYVLNDKNV
ncbi:uncharacterized protein LOC143202932 [Rhynchophorus ferrugineus]|uniref:uncharacterized protein LOC143202932 n=1 Tax=Rhynchophorus ferrugineus TaxID=354439 RepID=UPI003FCD32CD